MDVLEQQLMFIGGSLLYIGIGPVTDVSERSIPNWVTGPAMVAGLMLPVAAGCLYTRRTLAWEAHP